MIVIAACRPQTAAGLATERVLSDELAQGDIHTGLSALAGGLKPCFSVKRARVLANHGGLPFKVLRTRQRQAVLCELALVFAGVEFVVR
jgi:hypothetical protein